MIRSEKFPTSADEDRPGRTTGAPDPRRHASTHPVDAPDPRRHASTRPVVWLATLAMAFSLSGCLGCGGGETYIHMGLDRADTHERPVWVGVYFTNSATALDGRDIADLTNKETARTLGPTDGVIGPPYIQPVYPGRDPVAITLNAYDPAITHVLVVGNFPNAGECARQKMAVPKDSKLKIAISVDEDCLTVKKK